MRVLVTGSTGFIGAHLCRGLLEQGHQVRAFHRSSSSLRLLEGLEVEHAIGDLTLPDSLQSAMEGVEAVFHAAAWMGGNEQPGKLYAVTVEGTRAVLNAARKAGVRRLVHTSSVAALGVPELGQSGMLNENHTWNFRPDHYAYGYAKYLAELEVQKAVALGLDAVIVNPSVVFGAGDVYRQASSIVAQVAHRKVRVSVEGGINAVHVADVVAGEIAALERGRTGQRYILGGENLTYAALLKTIASAAGVPAPTSVLPAGIVRAFSGFAGGLQRYLDLPVAAETLHLAGYYFYYDLRKAQVELELAPPRPVRQAVEEAYRWFTGAPEPDPVQTEDPSPF